MVQYKGVNVEEAIQKWFERIREPAHESTYYCRFSQKERVPGLFGKKPAVVDIGPIAETTVTKANQQAVKGVPRN